MSDNQYFGFVDIRERLAYNLKRLRLDKGLSQEQFAFEAGIHRTYISDLERGARNPTISVMEKIAKALNVFEGELFQSPTDNSFDLK